MTDPTVLAEALAAEFAGDILYVPSVPANLSPPQVIVVPGDPYLAPSTHGAVEERWEVTVAVSIKEPQPGIDQMRDLSLRVMRVVQDAGAVWEQAGGPLASTLPNTQTVITRNTVRFKYIPPTEE
jgi:hypothetical protein